MAYDGVLGFIELGNQKGNTMRSRSFHLAAVTVALSGTLPSCCRTANAEHVHADHVHFSITSVSDGDWSDVKTWEPARLPKHNDRVLIRRGTSVRYDVKNNDVIRLLQIVGTLRFADDRDTELNVGLLKVQNSDTCSESGFACDFHDVNDAGEPVEAPSGTPLTWATRSSRPSSV